MLTSYADRGWVDDNNAKLMALAGQLPERQLLSTGTSLATQCPGDCFYDDGIHLNQNGQNYYACARARRRPGAARPLDEAPAPGCDPARAYARRP